MGQMNSRAIPSAKLRQAFLAWTVVLSLVLVWIGAESRPSDFPAHSASVSFASDERTHQQSLEIIRRRVDEVGAREPTIMRLGEDRILIQLPGIGSAAKLESLIGTTAQLTFHPVPGRAASEQAGNPDDLVLP